MRKMMFVGLVMCMMVGLTGCSVSEMKESANNEINAKFVPEYVGTEDLSTDTTYQVEDVRLVTYGYTIGYYNVAVVLEDAAGTRYVVEYRNAGDREERKNLMKLVDGDNVVYDGTTLVRK